MIAEPNRHLADDTLKALLEETLSSDQTAAVETHLCRCDVCRGNLEQLAGDPDWWTETVNVLSDSTLTRQDRAHDSQDALAITGDGLDHSLDWIRPLLDHSMGGDLGRIDHYPVAGVIGQGGMGVVLKGTDPELNRPVAIKVLSPHLAGVGAARARFMREAQAAAAIIHPSIVPIYSIATAGRLPYIVMPWISGGNLQERLNREGPLELLEILRIALQIAEGLAAAHRHGVIHRDIKPANILIEEGNGRVLISDFGLARALDDATLTMSGIIAGTPQYMSPEQAKGDVVDARSDLFSLGSLIYSLATGRPPFRADSPLAVLRKILDSRPRPAREINERIPAWLDQIIDQLMQADRNKRIQTADDAAQILRDALGHARNPAAVPVPRAIRKRRFNAKWLMAAAIVPVLCVGAAGLAYFAASQSNQTDNQGPHFASPKTQTPGHQLVATPQGGLNEFGDPSPYDWQGLAVDAELGLVNQEIDRISVVLSESDSATPTVFEPTESSDDPDGDSSTEDQP